MSDGPSWRSGSGRSTAAGDAEQHRQPWQSYDHRRGRDGGSPDRWGGSWRPAQHSPQPADRDQQEHADDTPTGSAAMHTLAAGRGNYNQNRLLSEEIAGIGTLAGLQQFVEQHSSRLNAVHVSQIMDVASKLRPPPNGARPLMDALAPIIAACARTYPARSLCSILRCWAHLSYRPSSELQTAMVAALLRPTCISTAPPMSIAISLWALSKLRWSEPQLVAALLQQAVSSASEFAAQNLNQMIYALAVMGTTDRGEDVSILLEQFVAKAATATPQELANVAWALATLRHSKQPQLFAAVVQAADSRVGELNTRDVSNIAWAVAKQQQDVLSNTVQHMLGSMARQAHLASLQDCSNSLWALAKLQRYDEDTCRALLQRAAQLLTQSPGSKRVQELSNIMYACGQLRHHEPQLLAAFEQHAANDFDAAGGQGCSNMLVALARLDAAKACPTAISHLARRLRVVMGSGSCNVQELTNSAWALACLQAIDQPWVLQLVQDIAGDVQRRIDAGEQYVPDNTFQLLQVSAELRARGLELEQVAPELLQRWAMAWRRQLDDESPHDRGSVFQCKVLASVQALRGVTTAVNELRIDEGMFSIDIAVTLQDGRRVAVEAEGPQHYTRSEPKRLMGDTVWRDRQLQRHGWEVVSVPVWEWDRRSPEKQREYLQQLLGISDDHW